MKYVSFNIRYDCGHDGINNFVNRKDMILRTIAEEKPDIIGFQEILPHVAQWLTSSLKDYTVAGCGRGEKLDGEQVSLAWKKDAFSLMEFRTFWLSPTPFVPGSRYPDQSDCPRTVSSALLEEKSSGRVFRVLNTHLDHVGSQARVQAVKQILSGLEAEPFFPDAPVILAGDFNAEPDSPEIQMLNQAPGFVCLSANVGETFHGYGLVEAKMIDYIYLRGNATCSACGKWHLCEEGVFLSDHDPVWAEISFA